MTTYFAQSSSNINASNVWNTAANGSGSYLTWPPASGDVLMANNKTITVNVDTNLGATGEIRNDTTGGATAGGSFALSAGITLTANVYTGSAQCVTFGAAAPNSATIVGNIVGGSGSFAYGVNVASTGVLSVTGTVTGGSASSGYGVFLNAASVLTITGNVYGASGNGVMASAAGSAVTINGDVYAGNTSTGRGVQNDQTGSVTINGSVYAGSARGLHNASTGTVIITGAIAASVSANGVVNAGTTECRVTGPLTVSAQNIPSIDGRWRFNSSMTSTYMEVYNHDGVKKTLYTTTYTAIGGLPATNNVRSGTVFGPSSELTGTLAVPPAASVSYGVPVDNTTGTASITASDIRAALGLASANLDSQLDALPTAAENATAVWGNATRTLTESSGGGATAEDVWTYATRSLTEAPDVPTVEEIAAEVRTELTPELSRVANCATVESTGDQLAGLL